MPELPEVETLCRQLRQVVAGRTICEFRVTDARLGGMFPDLRNCRITSIDRKGKTIVMALHTGMALFLHLRMSGKLLWQKDYLLPQPHMRFVMTFETGWLLLIDPRRFATLSYHPAFPASRSEFPLAMEDISRIRDRAEKRRIPIKAFLLDQSVVAGIGNIYACEILFSAAIAPERRACDLSENEWQRMAEAAADILKRAIRRRGTTISDWHDLFGQKGENQHHLNIYGREGESCRRCGAMVVRKFLAGRGTYACPVCQK